MSETAKIRLVRCPKCENLLPEVTDYSVYQCGGCGAVLRAKKKGVHCDEKFDEGRIVGTAQKLTDGYDKMEDVSERRATDTSDGSESDVRSSISSSSRTERHVSPNETNRENSITKEEGSVVHDDQPNIGRVIVGNEDVTRIGEKGETEGFWWARRIDNEVTDRSMEEGLSNPLSGPRSGNKNPSRDRSSATVEEFNSVDCVERDRAELLKKLGELKDQLSRSGNLIDKGKEKINVLPEIRRMPHREPYWHPSDDRVLMQNPYTDTPFVRNQYTEPPPLPHRQELGGRSLYPPSHHVPGYSNPLRPQMHRSGPYGASAPYQMYSSQTYRSAPYRDDAMAYMDPHLPNFSGHHLSCSCYQCHQKRSMIPNDRVFGYHENPCSFGAHEYKNHRQHLEAHHPARTRNGHARWPSNVDSVLDGFTHQHRARFWSPSGGKCCRPVAGGAPFLTCCNCFEVLRLSKRVLAKEGSRKKMRCGACSMLIAFTVLDGSLVVSYEAEAKENDREEVEDVRLKYLNQSRTTFSSEDYDNYDYDFSSTVRESEHEVITGQGNNRHSTSTYASEAEEDLGSADLSAKNRGRTSPPLGSSLQDHFEHLNSRSRDGNGSRSGRSEQETQLLKKTTLQQISRKESSATEIDLSSSEYGNTGTTFDSGEGGREGKQPKGSRGAESFFAGFIKKSFKDKSNEEEKASVTVNGHPIPNRAIKKAEKVAGPIHPGHYWYDFRAGFWGIMGGPCLGIIPPFIEEFNYPMPDGCAGGNTSVFVNGRQLNQKDLKLLGSRGLPTERDRSYVIDISGRVLDEDTGGELDSLGKLAPTVERMKRGFGMKAPKAAAA